MKWTSSRRIKGLEKKLAKVSNSFEKSMDMLKRQQKEVVHPLIEQVKDRDAKIERLELENIELRSSLKTFHSIIRLPRMTD